MSQALPEPGAPAPAAAPTPPGPEAPAWAAVGSMALGVFALMTAEFLPASLLGWRPPALESGPWAGLCPAPGGRRAAPDPQPP